MTQYPQYIHTSFTHTTDDAVPAVQPHLIQTPLMTQYLQYIPHFDQISVKISALGSYTLIVAPMGVKFGTEEGSSVPNFTPIGAMCRPCGAKNLKIGL